MLSQIQQYAETAREARQLDKRKRALAREILATVTPGSVWEWATEARALGVSLVSATEPSQTIDAAATTAQALALANEMLRELRKPKLARTRLLGVAGRLLALATNPPTKTRAGRSAHLRSK